MMTARAPVSGTHGTAGRIKRNPLTGSSLLVVLATALVTWIVSTFVFSHQHSRSIATTTTAAAAATATATTTTTTNLTKRSIRPSPPSSSSSSSLLLSSSNHKHGKPLVGRQGGHFKKNLHSYISMTNYTGPSTRWQVYPHNFPCIDGGHEAHMLTTPAHEGLLFQRPVKTGSTTLAAIILRLVERYVPNKRRAGIAISRCKYRAMHATSRELEFGQRKRDQSFLLSVVRDPTHKAISRYFHFDVSVGQKVPTDEHFIKIMRRIYNQNNLVDDLTTKPVTRMDSKVKVVQQILDDYDFIAVTERMDESLVVFKMLLKLDLYDILYIKARSSGTFSNGDFARDRPCVYLVPSFLTPGMQAFFESQEWKDSNSMDILLYQAVYQSLDNTIDALGRERVQNELSSFQEAQTLAATFCEDRVRGICSPGGTLIPEKQRTCVVWGEGCDFDCLREFRSQEGLKQLLN